MILPISICNFDAKNTPDAFKHVPGLFWKLRDRKTPKNHKTLKNLKLAPKKQLGILMVLIGVKRGRPPWIGASACTMFCRQLPSNNESEYVLSNLKFMQIDLN